MARRPRTPRGKLLKADITAPNDFRHIAHTGFDPSTGVFDSSNIDPQWKKLLDTVGVSEEQLQDENTATFIYDFVERHGGVQGANRQLEEASHRKPPPPPSRSRAQRSGRGLPPPPPPHRRRSAHPPPPHRRGSAPPPPPCRESSDDPPLNLGKTIHHDTDKTFDLCKQKRKLRLSKVDIEEFDFRHLGFDPNTWRFDINNIDPQWKKFLDLLCVTAEQLQDENIASFIYYCVEMHGGIDEVNRLSVNSDFLSSIKAEVDVVVTHDDSCVE